MTSGLANGGDKQVAPSNSRLRVQRPSRCNQCTSREVAPFLPARAMPERVRSLYCKLIRIKGKTNPFGLANTLCPKRMQSLAQGEEGLSLHSGCAVVCNFLRRCEARSRHFASLHDPRGMRSSAYLPILNNKAVAGKHGFRRAVLPEGAEASSDHRVICAGQFRRWREFSPRAFA